MLLIPCPNCGDRDQQEFQYGGRSIEYPDLDKASSIPDWHRALHLYDQTHESIQELWYHHSGCECWFRLTRNLTTHEFKK